jgi:hypothetical protein
MVCPDFLAIPAAQETMEVREAQEGTAAMQRLSLPLSVPGRELITFTPTAAKEAKEGRVALEDSGGEAQREEQAVMGSIARVAREELVMVAPLAAMADVEAEAEREVRVDKAALAEPETILP